MVCVVLGLYLFNVSQSITLVIVILLVVCILGFTRINRNFAKQLGKDAQVYKGKLYQWVNQSLGGVKEVKVLNREAYGDLLVTIKTEPPKNLDKKTKELLKNIAEINSIGNYPKYKNYLDKLNKK